MHIFLKKKYNLPQETPLSLLGINDQYFNIPFERFATVLEGFITKPLKDRFNLNDILLVVSVSRLFQTRTQTIEI